MFSVVFLHTRYFTLNDLLSLCSVFCDSSADNLIKFLAFLLKKKKIFAKYMLSSKQGSMLVSLKEVLCKYLYQQVYCPEQLAYFILIYVIITKAKLYK